VITHSDVSDPSMAMASPSELKRHRIAVFFTGTAKLRINKDAK
jgi:hypothetical protein